jgi:hypothetical protein
MRAATIIKLLRRLNPGSVGGLLDLTLHGAQVSDVQRQAQKGQNDDHAQRDYN